MDQFIAQAIGIVAMVFLVLSFQMKTPKGILLLQSIGAFLFSVNFFLLKQYIGSMLNVLAFVRAILLFHKEKLHTDSNFWLMVFGAGYIGAYILTFTVFGEVFDLGNAVLQCLPVLGMFCSHLALRAADAKIIRRISLASSVCWLIYNGVAAAIGAIACEAFNLVSILVAMVRLDRKKK
ncbi:MAG: YgjV family protein [Oscillospiraceae bacterium]|nr:YgjV family protein [Oscillospiraceae bacterium]